jgi:predicted nucleic acid-binding protein
VNDAFVDSSVLLAIANQEAGFREMKVRLSLFQTVRCSDLLAAEVRSVCKRDARAVDVALFDALSVVLPLRPLANEIARVLDSGYVRGADCFHLATALYLAPDPAELTFLTLDKRQRDVAIALGFAV